MAKIDKLQKTLIDQQFAPLMEALKAKLKPLPEPQRFNHCVAVFSKWRGNYLYIMQKFQAAGVTPARYFDVGVARLEYCSRDRFNLAYFRHNGKWFPLPMYEEISVEEAQKAILNHHVFAVF